MQECFRSQIIPSVINKTFIVLIPKTNEPSKIDQFRPISLCNFVYKIISKILATRLNCVMNKIIADNQGAFIKDWWIAENTILAQEIIYKVKKAKGNGGLMVLKI